MTLTEFLLARIDEHQERCQAMLDPGHPIKALVSQQTIRSSLDALAETRRIATAHAEGTQGTFSDSHAAGSCWPRTASHGSVNGPCEVLRRLAEPYADHPDYDEAWRPSRSQTRERQR
ncbi:DUF6221 family protein [Xylanimonas protaetiae]|uniref:Uncharacterized protein n=1 Tax=Xylanimonas protaetiae TaxID=2509457 RepID=A0A4P6F3A3_9MICO|nr:DUF6221 family protein [Xylanimonas protaetiae]QAY70004.1 hypothetical protein ET471_08140 [Xylanimonas protaetiae]